MDVGEEGDPGHQRSTDGVRDDEREGRLAADLAVDLATPLPRPKRRPSFSIVTSRRRTSPGLTTRLKRHSSIPANSPIRSPKPSCFATKTRHRLGERLHLEDAGHHRACPGSGPAKNHSVAVTALTPTIRLRLGVVLVDPVDEEERPAVRDAAARSRGWCGSARSRLGSGCGWRQSARPERGPSAMVRAGVHGSPHGRPAAARKAALPTRSMRFVVTRPSRNAALSSEGAVEGAVRDHAVHHELVEGDPRPGDRGRPVGAPDDELAEERVVVGRDLVAGVEVRVEADARAARGHRTARRCPAWGRKSWAGSSALIRNSIGVAREADVGLAEAERLAGRRSGAGWRRGRSR